MAGFDGAPRRVRKPAEAGDLQALIGLTAHRNSTIRLWAVRALGEIGDRRAIPALIALLAGSESGETVRALGRLISASDDGGAGTLCRPPSTEVAAAVDALAELLGALARDADDGDTIVRPVRTREVVDALVRSRVDSAAEALLELVGTRDCGQAAASGFCHMTQRGIGDAYHYDVGDKARVSSPQPEAFWKLFEARAAGEWPIGRSNWISLGSDVADGTVVYRWLAEEPLVGVADKLLEVVESDDEARRKLASHLLVDGVRKVTDDQLEVMSRSRERKVRAAAHEEAASRPRLNTRDWARHGLADTDADVRRAAAGSWDGHGTPPDELVAALSDPDQWVRAEAVRAFGKHPADAALPWLLLACADRSSWVRQSAAHALGAYRDRRAADQLVSVVADRDGSVVAAACGALAKHDPDVAVAPLRRLLGDERDSVSEAAAAALREIDREDVAAEGAYGKAARERRLRRWFAASLLLAVPIWIVWVHPLTDADWGEPAWVGSWWLALLYGAAALAWAWLKDNRWALTRAPARLQYAVAFLTIPFIALVVGAFLIDKHDRQDRAVQVFERYTSRFPERALGSPFIYSSATDTVTVCAYQPGQEADFCALIDIDRPAGREVTGGFRQVASEDTFGRYDCFGEGTSALCD